MKIINKIKEWYRGKSLPYGKVKVGNRTIILAPAQEYQKSSSAKFTAAIFAFWLKNWQYIITSLITLILGLLTLHIGYIQLIKTP